MAAGDLHPSLPVSLAFTERDTALRGGSGIISLSREAANLRRLSVGVWTTHTLYVCRSFPAVISISRACQAVQIIEHYLLHDSLFQLLKQTDASGFAIAMYA